MKTQKQLAEETAKAAIEEHAAAQVIDMQRPLPQTIQLTRQERLEAENLDLKMRLLEAEFNASRRMLLDADKAWSSSVATRIGVDLGRYTFDFATGTGQLKG